MDYEFQYVTSIGRRNVNQDACYVCSASSGGGTVLCAAVCDGVGGFAKGETASAETVREIDEWFRFEFPELAEDHRSRFAVAESLTERLRAVSERIFHFGQFYSMESGTTAAILVLFGRDYIVLNVGDSRVYRLRGRAIRLLTEDQTLAMLEVRRGKLSPAAAEKSPESNILTQCIGSGKDVVPEIKCGHVRYGDSYLLCTDGFRRRLSETEVSAVLRRELSGEQLRHSLEDLAETVLARGEADNLTAIAVKAERTDGR